MDELEKAWKDFDREAYLDVLHDQGDILCGMRVFDYESELVTILDERSILEVMPHFCDGTFWGWNVYSRVAGDLTLIDTFDTKEEGESLIRQLLEAIKAEEPYFNLPY